VADCLSKKPTNEDGDAYDGGARPSARHSAGVAALTAAGELYMRRFVLGWKKLGLETSLGTRLVTYADDLVSCAGGATPKRRCIACAKSWVS